MAVWDKWVALKVVEFLACVSCIVARRVSQDDEARLALLLQKLSREWSLLTSVTWDSVGGAFADAVYGGYTIITFGLILARVFQEIPKGKRILETFLLGVGMLCFLVLGGLELASLDSVPRKLTVNASVLGGLSLLVAALFLIDLMGPRTYFTTHHSQTDASVSSPKTEKKVSIATHNVNGFNGHLPNEKQENKGVDIVDKPERPKDLDLEKGKLAKKEESMRQETSLFDEPKLGYTKSKFDGNQLEFELEKSKYGSLRNELNDSNNVVRDFGGGNYIRLSDPLSELHYEQELAKFNERYFKDYLEQVEGKYNVKEKYLPEPQTPIFAKVRSGRLKYLYDDVSPTYEEKRQSRSPSRAKTVASPTLQQLEDYLKSNRTKRGDTPLFPMEPIEEKESIDIEGRASGTPSDRGYVQYTAGKWPDKRQVRTPRHSPTE